MLLWLNLPEDNPKISSFQNSNTASLPMPVFQDAQVHKSMLVVFSGQPSIPLGGNGSGSKHEILDAVNVGLLKLPKSA
jgi:hypothetical protein